MAAQQRSLRLVGVLGLPPIESLRATLRLFGAGPGPSISATERSSDHGLASRTPAASVGLDCRSYPREAKMIDWRNKTLDPQHVGVAVVKSRRSNFDGVWPPQSKPASEPASKPADPASKMPCGNDRCGSVSVTDDYFRSGRRRRCPPPPLGSRHDERSAALGLGEPHRAAVQLVSLALQLRRSLAQRLESRESNCTVTLRLSISTLNKCPFVRPLARPCLSCLSVWHGEHSIARLVRSRLTIRHPWSTPARDSIDGCAKHVPQRWSMPPMRQSGSMRSGRSTAGPTSRRRCGR